MIKEQKVFKSLSKVVAASLMSFILVIPVFADTPTNLPTPVDSVKIDTAPNYVASDGMNIYYVTAKTAASAGEKNATKTTWQRLNEVGGYNATGTSQRDDSLAKIDCYEHYTTGYEGNRSYLEYSWLFNGNDADWIPVTSSTQRPFYLMIGTNVDTTDMYADISFEAKTPLPGEAEITLKVPGLSAGSYVLSYVDGCIQVPLHGDTSIPFTPQADQDVTVTSGGYVTFDIIHGGNFVLYQQ